MISARTAVRLLGLLSLPIVTIGCLNLNKSYPEKRSFVLDVASEARPVAQDATAVLKVGKFRMSPLFVGRTMVYRTGELQYENDFYNEWFISPGSLLTQQVHGWLSKTGRFRFVLMGTNHIDPTHTLEGSVTEFYGDYRQAGSPKAVLSLELHLLEETKERQVVLQRTYRHEVSLADRSPDALAGGLTEALRLSLSDFDKDLGNLFPIPSRRLAQ